MRYRFRSAQLQLRPSRTSIQILAGVFIAAQIVVVSASQSAAPGRRASTDAPAKTITPNRTVPKVSAPSFVVRFSEMPATQELMHARVLPEPLRPAGSAPSALDNAAAARALEAFAEERGADATRVIDEFVKAHPESPWRAAMLANLGTLQWREGYFSRAAESWATAWTLTKNDTDAGARAVADYAVSEWVTQAMLFGQVRGLKARLDEIGNRTIGGAAGNKVSAAREGLWILTNRHDMAIFSGPEALKALARGTEPLSRSTELQLGPPRTDLQPGPSRSTELQLGQARIGNATLARVREAVASYKPSHEGTSLTALRDLSQKAGMPLEMRFIPNIEDVPIPSIIHLKSEHYSAVVARRDEGLVLRDPVLGETVMSLAALRDEATGYMLVPVSQANTPGRVVTSAEGETVFGHCAPGLPYDDEPRKRRRPSDPPPPRRPRRPSGPPSGCNGMPTYDLHPLTAAVMVTDTPLGCVPPRGPATNFTLRYNQRTVRLGQTPTYGNVGRRWSFDWLSYVQDNNTIAVAPYSWTQVIPRGEGSEIYNAFSGYTHWKELVQVVEVSHDPARWERRLPDGTVEVFEFADRAASLPNRKVFLTEVIDPQGQTLTFTYDSQIRLVGVTDALGQVTTLDYEDPADPLRVTTVTDPFGRTATLTYDAIGRLASITDAIGMTSSFTYDADDFMVSMTTPYGTTTFRRGPDTVTFSSFRRVEATDPEGGTERIEYHIANTANLSTTAPANEVPSGFSTWNQDLHKYNTLYWDQQAMAEAPGDTSRAVITHWLVGQEAAYDTHAGARMIAHSFKRPLETRIWYRYPGQGSADYSGVGTGDSPTMIARVLEGGATQLTQYAYNALGMVTAETDPIGRQTTYTYATNGIDPLEVRRTTASGFDVLASFSDYTSLHLPETITDAAGETTALTYNSHGQLLTLTNAKNETTTFVYDTGGLGYLQSVTGPVSGATTTFTYDSYGRRRTVTGPDGYSVTTDYDALDRVTKLTYPDSTYDEFTYVRLDLTQVRDRLGRVTRHFYDNLGRQTATRDALGRVIRQDWCACGTLDGLVDGNGHRTTWERDALGRVTSEGRADGTTETLYTYDATGRLKTVTDPADQVTTYTYLADDSLSTVAYTNATISTPGVTFTYDAVYPRVATMVDGVGTTTYTYKANGQLGAGQVASVDGPISNDVLAYTYDELGRVTTRTLNGSANSVTWAYDALGRITSEANVLGTFSYTYDGQTSRLASATYPNGQTSAYTYLGTSQDTRLQTIHHKYSGGATLSKFDYTYDAVGNILTWQQQADGNTATLWVYGYDAVDQLTRALHQTTGGTPTTIKRYAYGYDPGGNRTFEQIDDAITAATHDSLNRLQAHAPGGPLTFAGTVNEPATVTVQGQALAVDSTNAFRGTAPIPSGTSTVSVVATDASGNQATQQYEVDGSGQSKTFTDDENGNLTGDGTRTFEWDAKNRLVAVTIGTHRSEFTYDGLDRRVRIVEKDNSVVTRDANFIWAGTTTIEERVSTGEINRFFEDGEQQNGVAKYLTRDHLGSIREILDASNTIVTRNEYDPHGRINRIAGTEDSRFGFTGHYRHVSSGLTLSPSRAYDTGSGRWLSEDPRGLSEGPNLYAYVNGNPIGYVDPTGEGALAALGGVVGGTVGFVGSGGLTWVSGGALAPAIVPATAAGSVLGFATGLALENALDQTKRIIDDLNQKYVTHKKGRRPSTEEKHEQGEARRKRDRGGEKADWPDGPRRPPRKRPDGYKGPWPRKATSGMVMCEL